MSVNPSALKPPTRPPPISLHSSNPGVVPPKIPPRPNLSALSSSPGRTVKNATSSILGGILRRFPSGSALDTSNNSSCTSPPSATLRKSPGIISVASLNKQSASIPLEVSFDVSEVEVMIVSPKSSSVNNGNNNHRVGTFNLTRQTSNTSHFGSSKVHSIPPASLEEKFEERFEQLCNVSMESEALAKGLKSPLAATIATRPTMEDAFRKQYRLTDFELGVTLGTGSFGRVKFAKFKSPRGSETKSGLAIKMLKKDLVKRQNQVEHIKHERQILAALSSSSSLLLEEEGDDFDFDEEREPWMPEHGASHPFIVKLFGTFQTSTYLFMVLEFVPGGEFFTHLRTRGHFKNHEAIFYAGSVASVFAFLHSKHVAYRDLKPENLLLDHQGYVKVVDFGFAKQIPDNRTFTLCGTPDYIAPEVLMNAGHGKGVDWWALGVLTYEMLSGVSPFADVDTLTIYKKICKGLQAYPSYFEPDARSFTRRLLQVDVKKRYGCLANGAEDVLMHRWLFPIDHEQLLARKLAAPFLPPTNGTDDDTSCFDNYPYDPEDDCLGSVMDAGSEDPDFGTFSMVC